MASKNEESPFFLVYFGRPHSGKTYDLHQFVKRCRKEIVFVYNSGRDSDWPNYEEIELFVEDKALKFDYKGKKYDFRNDFMRLFKGKKVKAMEAEDEEAENLLYKNIKVKGAFKGLFFIIDDATGLWDNKLTKLQKSCFQRAKHAGVWFAVIFHDPAGFPNNAWNAVTLSRFFKNNVEPPYEKKRKIPHFDKVIQAFELLQDAPDYSHCTIEMDSGKLTYKPFKKGK